MSLRRPQPPSSKPAVRSLVILAAAAAALLAPSASAAYVRTHTQGDKEGRNRLPVYWNHPVLPIIVHTGAPPPPITAEQIMRATTAAAAAWSRQAIACGQMELRVIAEPTPAAQVLPDRRSHVVFRRDEWCKDPRPADGRCYDPGMLAVTSVFLRKSDGRILDADIEVNAVRTDWSDVVANPDTGEVTQDLQGALTHEFGHLLGFEHSCLLAGEEPRTDDQGQPSPSCAFASDAQDSVMIASVRPGKHIPRTLSADDIRGVCAVYPPVGRMVPGDHAGCALGPGRPHRPAGGATGLVLTALALLSAAARRRRPRPGTARR